MSVQALGWVLDHSPTKGTDRLVLVSIANHASPAPSDGAWEAWPGVELIRREAGLDRSRTVQDSLARLVDAGALERLVNGAPDERIRKDRRSNLYRVLLAHGVTCGDTRCRWCGVTRGDTRGDAPASDGVTPGDATGCREASPEPSLDPSLEPVEQPTPSRIDEALTAGFDRFWEVWPRKAAKGEARKAWPAAVKAAGSIDVIVDGARRYRDDPNRDDRYTAHPATWLRAERWNDEPLPPRAGRAAQPRRIIEDRDGPSGRIDL